jgi:hypothetical protein
MTRGFFVFRGYGRLFQGFTKTVQNGLEWTQMDWILGDHWVTKR